MFQVLFLFRLFIDLGHSKLFTFIFCISFFLNRLKVFLQTFLQEIMKRNNTWNIRRLVDNSFVPTSKPPSVFYCRLTDFCCTAFTIKKNILLFFIFLIFLDFLKKHLNQSKLLKHDDYSKGKKYFILLTRSIIFFVKR